MSPMRSYGHEDSAWLESHNLFILEAIVPAQLVDRHSFIYLQ